MYYHSVPQTALGICDLPRFLVNNGNQDISCLSLRIEMGQKSRWFNYIQTLLPASLINEFF